MAVSNKIKITAKNNKQQGVVLIVSLVFLIALTAVAAALMQNSTTDMKMSGASQEKSIALQEAISSMDQVIYNQVNQVNGQNHFTANTANFPILAANIAVPVDTTAAISLANPFVLEADCPHSFSASSVQVFKCNVLRVQVDRVYGRNNGMTIQVNSGIAQQLLNVGN